MRLQLLIPCVIAALLAGGASWAAAPVAAAKGKAVAANSGLPGARCKAAYRPGEPATGVSTTELGPAPAPYELGEPTRVTDRRRVMLVLHGGAWFSVGPGAVGAQRSVTAAWRAAGWTTVNADYRACKRSVGDVVAIYDLIRARYGRHVPVCVRGESAGGHLGLMLASLRSDVSCVIALATPTDLWSLVAQGRAAAADGSGPATLARGAQWGFGMARSAFGRGGLTRRSPVARVEAIRARVLLGTAAADPVVPFAQAQQLADALRRSDPAAYVDVMRLAAGSADWVHAQVASGAAREFALAEAAVVAPFGEGPATPVEPSLWLDSVIARILDPR